MVRSVDSFDRHFFTQPGALEKIRRSGSLSGGDGNWGLSGWAEYDFDVPDTGWYEVGVKGDGSGIDYYMDGDPAAGGFHDYMHEGNGPANVDKVGNYWLREGRHTLRLQRFFWTGFPRVSEIIVNESPAALEYRIRPKLARTASIFRKGGCAPLEIQYSGTGRAARLSVRIRDTATHDTIRRLRLDIPATAPIRSDAFPLPCDREGLFRISFEDRDRPDARLKVAELEYEVLDTAGRSRATANSDHRRYLVDQIDLTRRAPDYASGPTEVVSSAVGRYRQSGKTGWLNYQHADNALRQLLPEPDWFAYALSGLLPQTPYLVEVDYPDDALRTFAIALREDQPLTYPVAGGVDTGGEFEPSQTMRTHGLLFWPRSANVRLALLPVHDGMRAAASRVRVYRLDKDFPPPFRANAHGRHFANWYEEGSNFLSMYGAPSQDRAGLQIATDRWARTIAWMGGDTLMPTVSIYGFGLYPSRFHLSFSPPDGRDLLLRMLLTAERYGLRVIPELHPRADELSWPYASEPDPKPNLLVSKNGKTASALPPLFNPLHPANQDWYVGMVGELAERYAEYPALSGISLRLMQWANPALTNLHSLDWGYDDFTTAKFSKETGIHIPVARDDPRRFQGRHDWLMKQARAEWIDWRCRSIAGLYERIRDRVRSARPDLLVYINTFDAYPSGFGSGWLTEAGACPNMIREIDGVVMINSLHAYGRRYDRLTSQKARDNLVDPAVLHSLSDKDGSTRFISYARYMEATDVVATPEQLGLPDSTKRTWMSAAINPAGDYAIERFAIQLAETDAVFLGDGGNGYSLGQTELRQFLADYRQIPPVAFTLRADAIDPVAIREYRSDEHFWFYAVNRAPYAVSLKIRLDGGGEITRMSTGNRYPASPGMQLQLPAFRVMTFRGPAGVSIRSVSATVPASQSAAARELAGWLSDKAAAQQGARPELDESESELLTHAAAEARLAYQRGWLWRTRTIAEHHRLLLIYRKLGEYPPGLAYLAAP